MEQNVDMYDTRQEIKQVEWRVKKVEKELEKECKERKDTDNILFDKFDKLNTMIIYQLCAAILTLIAVITGFILK